MGLFSYVQIPEEMLPVEARGLVNWQTKDVIAPQMTTLVVTTDGELFEEWWEHEYVEDPEAIFGFRYKASDKHLDKLYFHGDMIFYAGNTKDPNLSDWQLIECRARFDEGKLRQIDYLGPWEPDLVHK